MSDAAEEPAVSLVTLVPLLVASTESADIEDMLRGYAQRVPGGRRGASRPSSCKREKLPGWLPPSGGALGDVPDALKRHQLYGGPYTRYSKECLDNMPLGTTECPRCIRPGDLLKQRGVKSTLGFLHDWAGGLCGVGSGGHGDRGSVEAEVGERLETVEKNPGPRRGGGRKKAAENRRARRERRYGRRRECMAERGGVGGR